MLSWNNKQNFTWPCKECWLSKLFCIRLLILEKHIYQSNMCLRNGTDCSSQHYTVVFNTVYNRLLFGFAPANHVFIFLVIFCCSLHLILLSRCCGVAGPHFHLPKMPFVRTSNANGQQSMYPNLMNQQLVPFSYLLDSWFHNFLPQSTMYLPSIILIILVQCSFPFVPFQSYRLCSLVFILSMFVLLISHSELETRT